MQPRKYGGANDIYPLWVKFTPSYKYKEYQVPLILVNLQYVQFTTEYCDNVNINVQMSHLGSANLKRI